MPHRLKDKKVLITGGAGFIGSHLCDSFLEAGNEVICLDNLSTGFKENISHLFNDGKFSFINGDIRDFETCTEAMEGVDVVLHQAALGSVPRSIADPLATNSVNITGFLNVLHAAHEAGVKRFVYAASSSTYGDSTDLPKVEHRIGKPLSPYAVTKYVNELYARVYADLFKMEVIGLRYFNVFGKRQSPEGAYAAVIPKFIDAFIRHESPVINGDGSQTRDFTYIKNVVEINHLAATTQNKEALGEVYNVAFGGKASLIELAEIIRESLSCYDEKIAEIPFVFGPERAGDVKNSLADLSKARRLLNYNPQHSLKDGIEDAIAWYWENLR